LENLELFSLLGIFILGLVIVLGGAIRRSIRRKKLFRKSFPDTWKTILEDNVEIYCRLPDDLKERLHGHMNIFLAEKEFEGCGGFEVTDEAKVCVAAQACLLLLNLPKPTYFPSLRTVLIYPFAYVANAKNRVGGQIIHDEDSARLGESWLNGNVILSWQHIKQGGFNPDDGHNVVIHEFAHQLDQENGSGNGIPVLGNHRKTQEWAECFQKEFDYLREEVSHHKRDVIDSYGATNPAEFFAVVTETFFEKPEQLKRKHAELYDELKDYYRLDPIQWV
jgi:Mlc titration factor MtfA (ptsG expression regulator)